MLILRSSYAKQVVIATGIDSLKTFYRKKEDVNRNINFAPHDISGADDNMVTHMAFYPEARTQNESINSSKR